MLSNQSGSDGVLSAFDRFLSSGDDKPCDNDDEECESYNSYSFHISRDMTVLTTGNNTSTNLQVPRVPTTDANTSRLQGVRRNQPTSYQYPATATGAYHSVLGPTESSQKTISALRRVTPAGNAKLKPTVGVTDLGKNSPPSPSKIAKSSSSSSSRPSSSTPQKSHGLSIWLIVGVTAAVILLLLSIAFVVYKYRSRDEGSYKIDESRNYGYEACNSKPMVYLNGKVKSGRHKRKDVEWYV